MLNTGGHTDWGALAAAFMPFIFFVLYLLVPVVRAFWARHSHKWAVAFLALLLAYEDFWYILENQHRDWPMLALVILYVWAFVGPDKIKPL